MTTAVRRARRASSLRSDETQPPIAQRALDRLDFLAPSIGEADGYGRSAQEMICTLEAMGVRVRLVGAIRRCGVVAPEIEALFETRRFQPEADAIVFYSQPTSWLRGVGRKSIGFSMFEADTPPSAWRGGVTLVDEVWVPSTFLEPIFAKESGKPTYVIPLAVDGEQFAYRRRERGERLRFLHFAAEGGDERKGARLAIDAFQDAFPDRDDVELVLRSQYAISASDGTRDARITQIGGRLSASELLDELYAADALLYPSQGEGFGLIPLEAMCTGLPAIYGAHSGMADFAHLGLAVGSNTIPAPLRYGGSWWRPDHDQLVERLRSLDTDYDAIMDRAANDAETIRSEWSWTRTARAMLDRLNS
jgi:glycosyltransferase involved in cell wall biosynthesis